MTSILTTPVHLLHLEDELDTDIKHQGELAISSKTTTNTASNSSGELETEKDGVALARLESGTIAVEDEEGVSKSFSAHGDAAPDEEDDDDIDMDAGVDASHATTNTDKDACSTTKNATDDDKKDQFTATETIYVFRLRVLVILVLMMAATAVSVVVYKITKGGEKEDFESSYEGAATKVVEAFHAIATDKLEAVASLSIAATASSIDKKDVWPFSTLSFFQERATAARKQSGLLFTSIAPMVKHDIKETWENYTVQDPEQWIPLALESQDAWDPFTLGVSLPSFPGDVHPGYILRDDWELGLSRDDSYGPFFPIWASSPLLKGLVNFNLASLPLWFDEIEACMEKRSAVIGRMLSPPAGKFDSGSFLQVFRTKEALTL